MLVYRRIPEHLDARVQAAPVVNCGLNEPKDRSEIVEYTGLNLPRSIPGFVSVR
jgi:hypothetical protein